MPTESTLIVPAKYQSTARQGRTLRVVIASEFDARQAASELVKIQQEAKRVSAESITFDVENHVVDSTQRITRLFRMPTFIRVSKPKQDEVTFSLYQSGKVEAPKRKYTKSVDKKKESESSL